MLLLKPYLGTFSTDLSYVRLAPVTQPGKPKQINIFKFKLSKGGAIALKNCF